jgi:hypothetical protein
MADFFENIAPKIGLTANAFRNLSGPQALQLYYDSLEKANLSQADLTFYLETMASDTTALIPLLRNGGERLSDMADEADRLGIVMSDLEIAQLDEFAGQFDRASAAISGMSNAVASELAPYLSVAVDYLFDAAEGADGFRDAMSGAVYESIAWLAQLVDEFLILDKNVQIATARMSAGFADFAEDAWGSISWLIDTALAGINNLIKGMNSIPGFTDLDLIGSSAGGSDWMQGFRDQAAEANAELSKLSIELFEMVNSAGPGADYLADVQAKIDEIRASVDRDGGVLSGLGGGGGGGAAGATDEIKAAAEAQKEYLSLVQRVNGVVESSWDEQTRAMLAYQDQVETLREGQLAGIISEDQYEQTVSALEARNGLFAEKNEELLEDTAGFWEKYMEAAEDSMMDFDQLTADVLEQFSSRFGSAFESMIFDAESLEEAVGGMAEGMARSVVNAVGQMIAQWLAYQAVQLLTGKTTQASAAATMSANAYAGVFQAGISAFASTAAIPIVGPALAPAAMGAAIAATSPMAAAVSSLALAGMAHDGIDSIPETGTWLLEKGERVTTADTSAKLDSTLARVDSQMNRPGDSGGGNVTVNQIEDRSRAGQTQERAGPDGDRIIDMFVANIMGDGKAHKAMTNKYGLSTRAT